MPTTLDERLANAKTKVAQLEHQRRVEVRAAREAEKKKNQRRNYILGELVSKIFPDEVLPLEPGTKAENAIMFEPFERFLMALAADAELMNLLKKKADQMKLPVEGTTPNESKR